MSSAEVITDRANSANEANKSRHVFQLRFQLC